MTENFKESVNKQIVDCFNQAETKDDGMLGVAAASNGPAATQSNRNTNINGNQPDKGEDFLVNS